MLKEFIDYWLFGVLPALGIFIIIVILLCQFEFGINWNIVRTYKGKEKILAAIKSFFFIPIMRNRK